MCNKTQKHSYWFEFFVDEFKDDHLVDKSWCIGEFNYKGSSWRECLYKFLSVFLICMITDDYEEKFLNSMIGLRHFSITCDGKPVDFNYVNRVIHKDKFLYKMFWC